MDWYLSPYSRRNLYAIGYFDIGDRPSCSVGGNLSMSYHRGSMRTHKSYLAFIGHRVSGLLLALFLPVHFLVLGLALEGADTMNRFLTLTELPWVKAAEWVLVVLLSVHLLFGFRVLMLELTEWPSATDGRTGWIIPFVVAAFVIGFVFLAQL